MSLLGSFKRGFEVLKYGEDHVKRQEEEQAALEAPLPEIDTVPAAPKAAKPMTAATPAPIVVPPATAGSADPPAELVQLLEDKVKQWAEPAYSRFLETMRSLEAIIPSKGTRGAAALKAVELQGHTIDKIVFDLDEIDTGLASLEQDLGAMHDNKIAAGVTALEEQAATKEAEIAALHAKIAQLGAETVELRTKAAQNKVTIETERATSLRYVAMERQQTRETTELIRSLAPSNPTPTK